MKVYAVIYYRGPAIAISPDSIPLFTSRKKANAYACQVLREWKESSYSKLYQNGSIHKDGRASLHYGCKNGYHMAGTVSVEERESRNYPHGARHG